MTKPKALGKRVGAGRKPNPVPTKAVRLPFPIANKLIDLKKRGKLYFLYRMDIGKIFSGQVSSALKLPYFESRVQAGTPFPGDDFSEGNLDHKEYLFPNINATFLMRVMGTL